MVDHLISNEEFLRQVGDLIIKKIYTERGLRGFSTNYRGNVIEIPIYGVSGCHYEIGLHLDCHEIALHFQSSKPEINSSRLNAFRSHKKSMEDKIGYPLILGPHENIGRKRLWVKLPIKNLTNDLAVEYSAVMSKLITETFKFLSNTIEQESI